MRLRSLPGLLVLAFVLLLVVPSAVRFYTDWLWFRELGYEGLFLRGLNAQAVVFGATFVAVFGFLYLNLRFARKRTSERPHVVFGTGPDGRPISLEGQRLAGLALPVSVGLALLLGISGAGHWLDWLNLFNSGPFGQTDPLQGRDVSFYVFRLPILQTIRQQALIVSLLTLIGCGVYYVFSGSFVIEARPGVSAWPRVRLVLAARRHLSLLTALVLGLMAWGAWLEIPSMLIMPAPTSVVAYGASYADIYARIPFLWATLAVLAIGAALSIWHGFSRRGWPLPLAIAAYFVLVLAGGLYAGFVQRFLVTPNEQQREMPFLLHNIAATRQAYALDRVEERELSGDAELSANDIVENASTIQNVRLWDHDPLLQTFGQIQEIRTYYDFHRVDNDRYRIDGKSRQVMLSVRELNTESMPNRSWINERLQFTHGYGLTLGPVNEVTTEGLPVLFVQDLPPVSSKPKDFRLDQPSVYYGELSNSYALVKTSQPEFHYPRGNDNVTTFYTGSGGVPVGGLMRRLLFAIRFASTDILVTNQINSESRIMYHRQIGERVRLLAPFLTFDSDPYPVINDGRLFWIYDAYTTTANYPYATPVSMTSGPINYIRNSVKVVIDAFHGSVTFYLAEPGDPLIQTIDRVFPGMLQPLASMPEGLRQHVRYPEDIFKIQAAIYTTYHMTNPLVFYNKEDQWEVPALDSAQNAQLMQPYYTIMRLPGEKQPEFIQMLPFTPRAKDNLAAWMVARSDGDRYGRLLVFQFPKQKIIFGPRQIVSRISQNQDISPQITLWGQQGSEVRWGTLLVIPVNESLIYVRPLYLRSANGRIPELKQVVVAYQDRIVMAESLTLALSRIFGRGIINALAPDQLDKGTTSILQTVQDLPPLPIGTADPQLAALAAEGKAYYDRAVEALRAGDLAAFGEEWKKLGDVFARIEKLNKLEPVKK